MATTPAYASTPRVGSVVTSNATAESTARVGTPAKYATVITGASTGTRLEWIVAQSCGTTVTSAAVMRFWIKNDTNFYLFLEQAITAITPSTTAIGARYEINVRDKLLLPSAAYSLVVTQSTITDANDQFAVTAIGADL